MLARRSILAAAASALVAPALARAGAAPPNAPAKGPHPRDPLGHIVEGPRGPTTLRAGAKTEGVVLAVPGDFITCPKGHRAFRVVEPVLSGGRANSRWLRQMHCDEPPASGVVPPCAECGATIFPALLNADGRHVGRYGLFVNGQLSGPGGRWRTTHGGRAIQAERSA